MLRTNKASNNVNNSNVDSSNVIVQIVKLKVTIFPNLTKAPKIRNKNYSTGFAG